MSTDANFPDQLWRSPCAKTPSLAKVKKLLENMNIDATDEEVEGYQNIIENCLPIYTSLDDIPEPLLSVRYPRKRGYRPSKEENPHNAWYWKTKISGANHGKLKGKTLAVKDSICVAGVPLMAGSRIMEGYVPDIDATVVTRALDEGAIVLGKSTTEDLCLSGNSFTSALGPVLNPYNLLHSAGGSSGGSAVLVATQEVDMALGSDQGGSIRMPAAMCGIVGLKPTFGLVPYTGGLSIEGSIDHLGPMARTVFDCSLLLEVLAGADGFDARQTTNIEAPEYSKQLCDKKAFKIGLLTEAFEVCNENVRSLIRNQLNEIKRITNGLEGMSMILEDVSIPAHNYGGSILMAVHQFGTYTTLFENHGSAVGSRGYYNTSAHVYFGRAIACNANNLSVSATCGALVGGYMKHELQGRYYTKAQNLIPWLKKSYNDALNKYDVLVMPTLPFTAPKLPKGKMTVGEYMSHIVKIRSNTAAFDASGHPAMSMNIGMLDGLPCGIQIVGKWFDELTVFQTGHLIEQAVLKLSG